MIMYMVTEHVIEGQPSVIEGQASVVGERPSVEEHVSVAEASIPNITIIPRLKELSKGLFFGKKDGKTVGFLDPRKNYEQCGKFTKENCVADLVKLGDKYEMKQRDNYTTTNKDKMPNHFLWDPAYEAPEELNNIFKLEESKQNAFNIADKAKEAEEYRKNWNKLFRTISVLVTADTKNIFICAHQDLLLHKFFKFKISKKFRNCCCIKVNIDTEQNVTMSVFHEGELPLIKRKEGETEEDFNKRKEKKENKRREIYLNETDYTENLKELFYHANYFPSKTLVEKKLNGKTIYIIRHGEGVHNVASKGTKLTNSTRMLNAMLTPEGVEQAQRLNTAFGIVLSEPSIYISSPLDRAIETLITAVMYNKQFNLLKTRFNELRLKRYGEGAIAAQKADELAGEKYVPGVFGIGDEDATDDEDEDEDKMTLKEYLAADKADKLAIEGLEPGNITERAAQGGKRRTRKGKRMMKSKKNKRMNMKKSKKNRKNKTRGAR